MKKQFVYIIICLFFLPLLYSCSCPCAKAELTFGLVGFSDSEADTIILRKFNKNSNFTSLKDTVAFWVDEIRFDRSNDTLLPVAYTSDAVLESAFDYEFYFPQSQSLFRISEIKEEKEEQNCGIFSANKVGCSNVITSCKINNTTFVMPGVLSGIYLRK